MNFWKTTVIVKYNKCWILNLSYIEITDLWSSRVPVLVRKYFNLIWTKTSYQNVQSTRGKRKVQIWMPRFLPQVEMRHEDDALDYRFQAADQSGVSAKLFVFIKKLIFYSALCPLRPTVLPPLSPSPPSLPPPPFTAQSIRTLLLLLSFKIFTAWPMW